MQWTSLTAGEHRVKVYGTELTYTLRISDLGADDVGDTTSAATTVTIEAPLEGRIGATWDVDEFIVEAPAGKTLDLSCGVPGAAGGSVQMYLSRMDDGQLLVARWLETPPTQDSLTIPSSGRFRATFRSRGWVRDYRCDWTVRSDP